jgi:hypothetical protein
MPTKDNSLLLSPQKRLQSGKSHSKLCMRPASHLVPRNLSLKPKNYRDKLNLRNFSGKSLTSGGTCQENSQHTGHLDHDEKSELKNWEKDLYFSSRNGKPSFSLLNKILDPPPGTRAMLKRNNSDYKFLKGKLSKDRAIWGHGDLTGLNMAAVQQKYIYSSDNDMMNQFAGASHLVKDRKSNLLALE